MSDIGNILSNSFPPSIDKTSKTFKSLVANYQIDKIDENNIGKLGLMERLIYDADLYCKKLYNTIDFLNYDVSKMDKLDEYMFKHFISNFCLPQTKYFRTERTMQICRLIFQRNGIFGWGTKTNLEYIFSNVFNCNVYIVENGLTYSDSLMKNGDFEKNFDDWSSNVGNPITEDNPFCGNSCVELNAKEYIFQTVTLTASTKYNFMFFLLGKAKVYIKNNLNEYWDVEVSEWTGAEKYVTFETLDYENMVINFNAKVGGNIITFMIESDMDSSFIDYVRLFEINYPCFNVLLRTVIETAADNTDMVYGPDSPKQDIIPEYEKSYENTYGYYGSEEKPNAFYTGTDSGFSQELQTFLLDYLRAAGVRGVYERVTVDRTKSEAYVDGKTLVVPYGNVADETFNNKKTITDGTFNA